MLNQVIIVGRLVNNPEVQENENGNKSIIITLAIPRTYKNINGEYDTDFITCKLWEGIAKNAEEFLNKGDLVGVRGRLESKEKEIIVIAEKITFLSSKKEEEEE